MILDTNALSALVDGEPKIEPFLRRSSSLAIPVIVLGEYRYGIARSSYRNEYEEWLQRDLHLFRLLEINSHTAEHYANIRLQLKEAGTPIPENDLWIAATAIQYELPILTRDQHFNYVNGLDIKVW